MTIHLTLVPSNISDTGVLYALHKHMIRTFHSSLTCNCAKNNINLSLNHIKEKKRLSVVMTNIHECTVIIHVFLH